MARMIPSAPPAPTASPARRFAQGRSAGGINGSTVAPARMMQSRNAPRADQSPALSLTPICSAGTPSTAAIAVGYIGVNRIPCAVQVSEAVSKQYS
jgi:hypothetical protein